MLANCKLQIWFYFYKVSVYMKILVFSSSTNHIQNDTNNLNQTLRMKKLNLLLGILIGITIIGCSSDNDNTCDDVLEPEIFEFTYDCERHEISEGRLNIKNTYGYSNNIPDVINAQIEFTNSRNGVAFDYFDGDSGVNFIEIWIKIPFDNATERNIPAGIYTLNEQNPDNPFDIVNARFSINSNVTETYEGSDSLYFSGGLTYGWDFEQIEVVVEKINNVYTIEFILIYDGKTIKGKYSGEMEVVDTWS